ncbi:MAG: alpha/beta hydrolase, partial [Oscillospiraceae bacterium]|nr:alpha/beta hydrolase [Oscillospiraceae bacterium]
FNVLLPHLAGHGLSDAKAVSMGIRDRLDVIDWVTYITSANPGAEIALFGVSMGAATVMCVTGEELPANVKCAVEDCGFTGAWEQFISISEQYHIPKFPALSVFGLLAKIHGKVDFKDHPPIVQVTKSKTPTLFIHGGDDKYVPYWMLNALYDHAACEKRKLTVPGAKHANSNVTNPELYYNTVFDFVGEYIGIMQTTA